MSDVTAAQSTEISRYSCPVCGRPASDLASKKAHIKREHPRAKGARRG